MQLKAWRTIIPNPVDAPQISITIAPAERTPDVYPWILPLGVANKMFGEAIVGHITEVPVEVDLSLQLHIQPQKEHAPESE